MARRAASQPGREHRHLLFDALLILWREGHPPYVARAVRVLAPMAAGTEGPSVELELDGRHIESDFVQAYAIDLPVGTKVAQAGMGVHVHPEDEVMCGVGGVAHVYARGMCALDLAVRSIPCPACPLGLPIFDHMSWEISPCMSVAGVSTECDGISSCSTSRRASSVSSVSER